MANIDFLIELAKVRSQGDSFHMTVVTANEQYDREKISKAIKLQEEQYIYLTTCSVINEVVEIQGVFLPKAKMILNEVYRNI